MMAIGGAGRIMEEVLVGLWGGGLAGVRATIFSDGECCMSGWKQQREQQQRQQLGEQVLH